MNNIETSSNSFESKNFQQHLLIDQEVFEQILALDEDEVEHEFSKDLVLKYFEQVETTLKQLDDKIQERDLTSFSKLGHFLKGSSGQLGLTRMEVICKSMQDISAGKTLNELAVDQQVLEHAAYLLSQACIAFEASKQYLIGFYKL